MNMKNTLLALLLGLAAACGSKTTAPPKAPDVPAASDEPTGGGERTPATSFDIQDNHPEGRAQNRRRRPGV